MNIATQTETLPWKRHLWVVVIGSFTTVSAMGLVLPFLPLYFAQLGVHDPASVSAWSGAAYSATFVTAGLTAPLWGRLGDRWGRKSMLIRASLGMAMAMSLTGLAQDPYQLVGLRLLTGLLGGYSSGAMILVAAQAPKEKSGWALGVLSAGITAGFLAGPLLGGILPALIGIRATFLAAGAVIFVSFLGTALGLRHDQATAPSKTAEASPSVRGPVFALMLMGGLLVTGASLTIEPILALYVGTLVDAKHVTVVAGLVFAATALGSLLSSTLLGRLADKAGPVPVLIGCLTAAALFVLPQAFVGAVWQLAVWRFLLGAALGGLLPSIAAILRKAAPPHQIGRVLGLSTAAQYAGQVVGPMAGGFLAGWGGFSGVLIGTGTILFAVAAVNLALLPRAAAATRPE